ncbi:MAG: hypothetical protein KGL39_44950 [Patescibacteria group bacterium]|nr:hypothetical protein [Patescibacteria group bacterium]
MIALRFIDDANPFSEAIKLFERGWCAHVDAVMPGGSFLGARLDGGVASRPADYIVPTREQYVHLAATPQQESDFYAFLNSQLGKPYDTTAIAAFAVERDWRTPDSWFCSELQARALEICGFFPKPLASPANEITPRDLLLCVSPWAAA